MVYYANGFQPTTAIGATLANLSNALFAGQVTPNQQKQLELEKAKTDAYIRSQNANADFDEARAASERDMLNGKRGFGANQVKLRFGERAQPILNYYNEGVGNAPEVSPDEQAWLGALFRTGDAVRAGGGNADQILKAQSTSQDIGLKDGYMSGRVSPTQLAVTQGKAPIAYEDGVRYNQYDLGIPQVTDALFDANVGYKRAQAGKETAQANKYANDIKVDNANLDINRGKAEREKMVGSFVGYDASGNEVYQYTPQREGNKFTKPAKPSSDNYGITFNAKSPADLDAAISSALGLGENDELPEGMRTQIRTELSRIVRSAGSKGFTEEMLAQAISNVAAKNPDAQVTNTNWIDTQSPLADKLPKQPGVAAKPKSSGGITKEEYDALPIGAKYTAPDGTIRTKGGA